MAEANAPPMDEKPPPYSPPAAGWNPPTIEAHPQQSSYVGGPSTYYATGPATLNATYAKSHPEPLPTFYPSSSNATVVVLNSFGRDSLRMLCPFCRKEVNTDVDSKPSMKAYLSSALICFLGCYLGCCLIPFCMESCMNVEHKCPSCKKYLGRYDA